MKYDIVNHRGNIEFIIDVPDWLPAKAKTFANKATKSHWNNWVEYADVRDFFVKDIEDCPRWYQVLYQAVLDGLLCWIQENDTPNDDGESRIEYFAYGYQAGDPPDFQRLLVDAVATVGGRSAYL